MNNLDCMSIIAGDNIVLVNWMTCFVNLNWRLSFSGDFHLTLHGLSILPDTQTPA